MKTHLLNKKLICLAFFLTFFLNVYPIQAFTNNHSEENKLADIKPIADLDLIYCSTESSAPEADFVNYISDFLEIVGIITHPHNNTQSEFITNLESSNFDLALVNIKFQMNGTPLDQQGTDLFQTIINNISFYLTETFIAGGSLNFFNLDSSVPYYNESLNYIQAFSSEAAIIANLENWYAWQELIMDKILPFIPLNFRTMVENNTEIGLYTILAFNLNNPFIGGDNNTVFLTKEGYEEYSKAAAIRKAIAFSLEREIFYSYPETEEHTEFNVPFPVEFFNYSSPNIVKYTYNYTEAIRWIEFAGYKTEDLLYYSIKHPKNYVMLTLIYFLSFFSIVFDFYLYKRQLIYLPAIQKKQTEKDEEENVNLTEKYYVSNTIKKLSASVFFYFSIFHLLITLFTTFNKIIPTLIEGGELRLYGESYFGLILSNLFNLWFIPLAFILSLWTTILIKQILEGSKIKITNLKFYYIIPLLNVIYVIVFFLIALEIAAVMVK